MVTLKDDQLSATYVSADDVSGRGQKRTKFFVKLELVGLIVAALATARELSIIRDRIDWVDEAEWPQFVSDSEDAISREHTMWLARHGHLIGT